MLIGIEAFTPAQAPVAAGHRVVGVGYARLEAGGWYLVRRVNGHYATCGRFRHQQTAA